MTHHSSGKTTDVNKVVKTVLVYASGYPREDINITVTIHLFQKYEANFLESKYIFKSRLKPYPSLELRFVPILLYVSGCFVCCYVLDLFIIFLVPFHSSHNVLRWLNVLLLTYNIFLKMLSRLWYLVTHTSCTWALLRWKKNPQQGISSLIQKLPHGKLSSFLFWGKSMGMNCQSIKDLRLFCHNGGL